MPPTWAPTRICWDRRTWPISSTLDGVPEEHDKRRVYPDGRGSFAAIADNVTMALSHGARISIRLNVDRVNVGHLPRLARIFEDRGWSGHQNFVAYTAPITGGNGKTERETLFSSWELDQALDELRAAEPSMNVIDRPDDRLRNRVLSLFSHGGHPGGQPTFCGAHTGMYVIDRFGDMYACWERTGNPKIRIGRIAQDGTIETSEAMSSLWRNRTVTSNPVCKQCRYALYCGGGCAVLAEGRTGRLDRNYCDGFGFRLRAMVAEAYTDHAAGKQAGRSVAPLCDN
ncbi:radical SAM protein with 4Fe4S-binding SPASM domain [Catenulispora sp. GAS73]